MKKLLLLFGKSVAVLTSVAALCLSALSANAAITDVAVYHLGEAGSLGDSDKPQDSSGNAHHFTESTYGSVTVTNPAPVSGSTAALNLTYGDGFYNTGTWTVPTDNFGVELWVRPAFSQSMAVFMTGAAADSNLRIDQTGGNWGASYNNAGSIGPVDGVLGSAPIGTWTHVAVIRSNGTSRLYLNGAYYPSATTTNAVHSSSDFHLGVWPMATAYWQGDIDELRIFTFNPATDDPVAALNFNGPDFMLLADYPLGEDGTLGINNTPRDSSPFGRDIMNGQGATVGAGIRPPERSKYLSFDGNDYYYGSAGLVPLPDDNYGFDIWARVPAGQAGQTASIATVGNEDGCYQLMFTKGGWALARFKLAWIVEGAPGFRADAWTHLAVVRDGGVTRFFINGAEAATDGVAPVNNGYVHLGIQPGGFFEFRGDLDHMRVFQFKAGTFDSTAYRQDDPGTLILVH